MPSAAYLRMLLLGASLALPACQTLTPATPLPAPVSLTASETAKPPEAAAGEFVTQYQPFAFLRHADPEPQLDQEFFRALQGQHPDKRAVVEAQLLHDVGLALDDYSFFYSPKYLFSSAVGIGLAAPVAHTSADRSIRDWYQRQVKSHSWDKAAEAVNLGGQVWIFLPVWMEAMALCGQAPQGYEADGGLHEWSNRSLRAIAVGQPPVVVLYFLLGSGRPDRGDSRWRPFQDIRGASGHTFTGAIPFLTAAEMTDNWYLKTALYAGSALTGWSRIHKDRHYFSQVMVGWWMAYLAVRSVDETQQFRSVWSLVPMSEEGPGVGLLLRF